MLPTQCHWTLVQGGCRHQSILGAELGSICQNFSVPTPASTLQEKGRCVQRDMLLGVQLGKQPTQNQQEALTDLGLVSAMRYP